MQASDMGDFEREISHAIRRRTSEGQAPTAPSAALIRRIKRRKASNATAAVGALLAIGSLVVFGFSSFGSTSGLGGTETAIGKSGAIAFGGSEQEGWGMDAYVREAPAGAASDGPTGDALCFRLTSEAIPSSDYSCSVGWNQPLPDGAYIEPVWLTTSAGEVIVYGRISREAKSLSALVDGRPVAGQILEAPKNLDVSFNFFAVFAPEGAKEVQLSPMDASGNQLETRTMTYPDVAPESKE